MGLQALLASAAAQRTQRVALPLELLSLVRYNCLYGTPTVPRDIHLGVVDHYSEEAKRVKTLCGRKTCLGVIDSP